MRALLDTHTLLWWALDDAALSLKARTVLASLGSGILVSAASASGAHEDPFDRILIAQCMAENVPIVSRDEVFDVYAVQRIW